MSAVQRVLMVCTANICRSPTAEAVLRHRVQRAGLHGRIVVDSAGTRAAREQSHPPDPRSLAHAARRGYDLTGLRSRPVVEADFRRFDLIVAMDRTHLEHLRVQAPADTSAQVRLLMSFAPSEAEMGDVVPDPYYGSAPGFEHVLDLVELACDGLLEYLYSPQGSR
jgi:protein-tyrosine phosphatase